MTTPAGAPGDERAAREARARERARERRLRWTVRLGVFAIRLLARTWRIRERGSEHADVARVQRRPVVYAFWHSQMLPLLWHHRDQGVAVLISEHRDGELIARAAQALGYRTVRGSTTRGAGRALIGLISELERGGQVAVTPDGPRGPAHEFAPGAAIAAQRAGVPILPLAVHAERAWRLRSWDRFLIPKPFSRITVVYGALTMVEATDARAAALEAPRLGALLDGVGAEAARG